MQYLGDVSHTYPCRVEYTHSTLIKILTELAKEGMLFTDAHSPSTVCTPTRYSILTGRMAFRLNYKGVFTGVGGPCLITPGRLTLSEMLRQKGYKTAMFGKWHIGITAYDKGEKTDT